MSRPEQPFGVFRYHAHPVFALRRLPAAVRRRVLRLFPAYSPKTRLAARLLRTAAWAGADWAAFGPPASPFALPQLSCEQLEAALSQVVPGGCRSVAFAWPPPARSTTRAYAHLLSPSGEPLAFAKLAFAPQDAAKLANETDALRRVGQLQRRRLAVPDVIGTGEIDACRYAVFSSIPGDAVPVDLSWERVGLPCWQEFAGEPRHLSHGDVRQQPWWRQFAESSGDCAFARELAQLPAGPLCVCRTHGDFLLHNMRQAAGRIWVLDWEEYTENGPLLTDEIAFVLCLERFGLRRSVPEVLRRFAARYLTAAPQRRRDVLFAVAFLSGTRAAMASTLVEHWAELPGPR